MFNLLNIKILIHTIFLLALLPIISTSTAQDATTNEPYIPVVQRDVLPVYPFVQIVHRDSNDNLLTFIESDRLAAIDNEIIIAFLDHQSSLGLGDPIYKIGQDQVQVIVRQETINIEKESFYADTTLIGGTGLEENEGSTIVLRFNHDGFIALPGDKITYYWNFIRYL